ncbi:MAG: hypothetical protein Q7T07_17995 [Burkholderiaceae bacterium]|nr:hypothetical protein [Burkholderiaceae bacterium]
MSAIRVSKTANWASQAVGPVRLFALVLSLLLAQALGFMHGIEHAPHTNLQATQFQSKVSDARTGWVADLFAGHSEESTCQVFDQLSHGSALLGHAVDIAPLALASFFLDTYRGATPPYQRSLIQARGPPAVFTTA